MDIQASIEQVAGILLREGLAFETHEDGCSYRLRFGPDAVFIHFDRWNDGTRLLLTAPALQEIDVESPGYAIALNALNALNRGDAFTKWMVVDGTLMAAHDLLGDALQAAELVNAVNALALAVDDAAGTLADAVGGTRYFEGIEADVEE